MNQCTYLLEQRGQDAFWKKIIYSSGFLTMGSFDRTQTFELSPFSKLASYV